MGVNIGIGVFVAEAGANRLAIHQGANDGFRGLSAYCFDGPDTGKGFVILCNADSNGVLFVAEVAQQILEALKFTGVNYSLFSTQFDSSRIPQEEVVNNGYKNLVFRAFEKDLPEAIAEPWRMDTLADYNLAVGGMVLFTTNQRFRAENLLSSRLPVFNPILYGRQGHIMESWETFHHNRRPPSYPRDELIFEMIKPSSVHYVSLSTKFHYGNQAEFVKIEGKEVGSKEWKTLVPKIKLEGHALKQVLSQDTKTLFHQIKASIYPNGGFTRLGLYTENLPADEKSKFKSPEEAISIMFRCD